MKLETLHDVLVESVKDLYSAETQLTKALPKMSKAAHNADLKTAFEKHLAETENQAARLEQIGKHLNVSVTGKTCAAMKGLITEGQEIIDEDGKPDAKDAALIGAAQKVEHYEIAGYGTAKTYAHLLGLTDVAKLLEESLAEETAADKKLTAVAESGLAQKAAGAKKGH